MDLKDNNRTAYNLNMFVTYSKSFNHNITMI